MAIVAFTLFALAVLLMVLLGLREPTPRDVAGILERFLSGKGHPREWQNFLATTFKDPALEAVRMRCAWLRRDFPSQDPSQFCSEEGMEAVRECLRKLQQKKG